MKMQFCPYCGTKLDKGARFCKNCGEPVIQVQEHTGETVFNQEAKTEAKTPKEKRVSEDPRTQRKTVYDGELHKCPNCGEILKAFELNCPACGYELRGTKVSGAVKEFALKLEAIESRREYEKPRGLFAAAEAQQRISKTDEQKISLIRSFSIPNSKEDMLEFMILATSNMNMSTYDSTNTHISKSEKEINAAWFSKVQQVYEKAKRSYSTDSIFSEIEALYNGCIEKIKKTKKKGTIKWIFMLGWIPAALILVIIEFVIFIPKWEREEIERLDGIVLEVQQALDSGEYSHALRLADSIDYQRHDVEMEREWDIQREYWVEKVLQEAEANGEDLEYTLTPDIDNANDESN